MPHGVQRKENRTITISIPRSLVADIDALAQADGRTRSNWVVRQLEELVRRKRGGSKITHMARAASNIILATFALSIAA
jgi:metal-responsive CopG/Arc/MetJ family transcriptional regulator